MVTKYFFFILFLPAYILSAEFNATVNHNRINVGESVLLTLTLRDASAQGNPQLDGLKNDFLISSQHQSANTFVHNGHVSSSTSWKINIIPQKEGDPVIPSLSIETSAGKLSTKPITIHVAKDTANSAHGKTNDMAITIDVSNPKPYKNEPVIYTVRLNSKKALVNIRMEKPTVEEAIVDLNGEPKAYHKVVDGVKIQVIEFSYLITPLKAGPLKIPSMMIQGETPVKRSSKRGSFFDDDFHSLYDDEFDPFGMMGFAQYQPFVRKIDEVDLDVQPPVPGINPWLAAKSFKIEEKWDESQNLQIGEPVTRSFIISAEGIKSSQLPSLSDQLNTIKGFKVYADKPELKEEVQNGKIISTRKEEYTLIPQKTGPVKMPGVSISWWDLHKNEKAVAHIPPKKLKIEASLESPVVAQAEEIGKVDAVAPIAPATTQNDPILYIVLGALSLLLLLVITWAIILQRKLSRKAPPSTPKKQTNIVPDDSKYAPPPKNKKEKLPDLNPT